MVKQDKAGSPARQGGQVHQQVHLTGNDNDNDNEYDDENYQVET